ncbi:hypothetical protein QUB80_24715 [Chlorogloeopsis sp. ULAP01]|uniref:hypothetical protein n=1 Tax=Chlorogloeopsis sp. ULAP01 TaxID=3056483 RepID=UPI0025AAE121|nr:hypothetical protein [Chlorogloeopsis sp. ULAP01]MDM9383890.1 hypothetical protein [Chlorogloeopsis sp. ULAP01]
MMPKFYLHRAGKIPTTVHPFVKQTALLQYQQKPEMIRGVQNIASSTYRKISIAIAHLIQDRL